MAIGNPTQVGASGAGGTASAPWSNSSGQTTRSTASTCVIPANSLVVTVVLNANATVDPGTPTQVTDGTNTVTTADETEFIGNAGRISIFSWYDTAGRTATITASFGSSSATAMYVFTLSGAATSAWLDQTGNSNSSAATNMAVTTAGNVAQNDEVSIGAYSRGSNIAAPTTWPGAGYTSLANTTESVRQKGFNIQYKNGLTSGSTETSPGLLSASSNIARVIVTYKGAAAGGGTAWTQSLADTITLSDAIANAVGLSKSDTITLSDAATKGVGLGKADTITLSDAATKAMGVSKADTITLSDSLTKAIGHAVADTITLNEAFSQGHVLSKADIIHLADSITIKLNGVVVWPAPSLAPAVHRIVLARWGFQ